MYLHPNPHLQTSHLTPPDRTKRVKDARNEAQKEIDDYKKEKDNEYQKFESEVRMNMVAGRSGKANGSIAQLRQPEGRGRCEEGHGC